MKPPLKCRIWGHRYSRREYDKINDGTIFARLDCQHKGCDNAIDGAALKRIQAKLPASLSAPIDRRFS